MTGMTGVDVTWTLLKEYARQHPWVAASMLLSLLVVPVQDILLPHLTGKMVSAIKDNTGVLRPFTYVVVGVVAIHLCYIATDLLDAKTMPSVQRFFRRRMLECTMRSAKVREQGDVPTGDYMAKVVKAPVTMAFWFESVKVLVPYVLVYVAAVVYFSCIDRVIGAAMAAAVVLLLGALAFTMRRCTGVSTQRDAELNAVHEDVDETLRNLAAVVTARQLDAQLERLSVRDADYARLSFRTTLCSMTVKACMVPAVVALMGLVIVRCRRLTGTRAMSTGTFVSVILVIVYLSGAMMRTAAYTRALVFHWGVVNASADVFSECDEPHEKKPGCIINDAGTGIGMRDVAYKDILHGLTFTVPAGACVALLGPVGAGKSTILRLLAGLIEPSSGTVGTVGRVAYVPQTPTLFDRSVLDNVLFGSPTGPNGEAKGEADVWRAAERIGATQTLRDSIGLHTPAGKGGSRLSGGQRQLVWMLRVLVSEPVAVLMDEPTSAMDDATKAYAAATIRAVGTAVVATHDVRFARSFATHEMHIKGGTMVRYDSIVDDL